MKFGRGHSYQHVCEVSKQKIDFIKSYSTTHFLTVQMNYNLQNALRVVLLTFLQNLKQF